MNHEVMKNMKKFIDTSLAVLGFFAVLCGTIVTQKSAELALRFCRAFTWRGSHFL